jgi:uncharacterized membrane protein (UPF0136 family)
VWVFLLLLPTALVFQVAFLNTALRHFPAAEAVPLYQSQVVIWGVIFGWTLYAEGAGKSGGQVAGFIAGIVVIVCGIFILLAKRRPVPPTLTVLEAVKALAVGELLVQVTALRRARTAPGSLADVVEASARCRSETATGCDTSSLASLQQLVPVQTSRGTAVRGLLLIHPRETTAAPVSPRELLAAPTYDRPAGAGAGGGGGKPGDAAAAVAAAEETQSVAPRRRVPPSLRVNVLLPAGYRLQSEPTRDRRYRATASVATVSELLFETEVPGVPELTRAAAAAAAADGRRRQLPQQQQQQPLRARGPAAAQLSLFLPPGLDYVAAPLAFIPPPVAAGGGELAASARTIGGSVRRVYPSLRRIGLVGGGSPVPVAVAGTQEARDLPLWLPLAPPLPPPRPARERVLSAPAQQLQLPPRAGAVGRQRAALAEAGASAARLSPVAEEREEAAAAVANALGAAVQRPARTTITTTTTIASPPPDFVRRARSLSAAAAAQLTTTTTGGDGGFSSGLAAVPVLPLAVVEGAVPPDLAAAADADTGGGGGGEEPMLPVAVLVEPGAAAAAGGEDVQPPVVEEGEPSGGTGQLVVPPLGAVAEVTTPAAAAAAAPSPPPPFPSLISVPLAVIQTLPGIDVFLLTSFLRAEASAEFEAALAAAAEERRRVAAEAAAKRQAAGRRQWGRRRAPLPPPSPLPAEQAEVLHAAPAAAAPAGAAGPEAAAATGAGEVTVAVAPKTAPPAAAGADATAPAVATAVVSATTTTTVVGGARRRRSLSNVQSALLPVLALPAVPGAGAAVPPSPLPRGHVPALSSEPVLALAQLHALGSPGAVGRAAGAAGGTRVTAAGTTTVAIYAGLAPATAPTPTGGAAVSAARQQQGPGAAAGEERDVTGGEL